MAARTVPLKAGPRLFLEVQDATRSAEVPDVREFRRWARAALRRSARVTIRIVGAAEGRRVNRAYRGMDYATNVLTFVYESAPRRPLAGDLLLCAPVIAREAREQGKAVAAHYAHLTIHGLLHLQGWEHEDDGEARAMEAREARLLARLGYPDPYSVAAGREP
jgi:probable rRNA maturation factor